MASARDTFIPKRPSEPPRWVSIGERIGEMYELEHEIGRGGMGVVFRAHDHGLNRKVAIKIVAPEHAADSAQTQAFLREARAMAGVRHENVVHIFAFGTHRGLPYFVMENVPGEDLGRRLDRLYAVRELPAFDETIGVLDQVCRGLTAIHEQGIVHADVKPGNILIGPSFHVAVTDFGLVRALGERDRGELIVGTPEYIAPEVVYSREPVFDPRSDVYGVGVVAYEMFTGQLPLRIPNVEVLFDMHLKRVPILKASEVRPDLPPAFDDFLERALTRDLKERFATMEEMRRALFAARASITPGAAPPRILIVDDDPMSSAIVAEALRFAFSGAELHLADSGAEGLALLKHKKVDLVVLDLNMPTMNGIEFTANLRGDAALHDLPVVVVTAYGGSADWRLLQSLGAQGFLVKPIDPYALVALARRAIGLPAQS